jgi:predicted DCC family thiol-disulfide oxidoreductase YuxK
VSVASACILFYDGECGLCDRAVMWLWDRTTPELKFAPLQGVTASRLLPAELTQLPLASLVVYAHGQAHVEVGGLRTLVPTTSGVTRLLLQCLTHPVLAWATGIGYRWVVRHRHRLFRPRCLVPQDKGRLLP